MENGSLKLKLAFVLAIAAVLLFVQPGYSQQMETVKYPTRPITFIVPVSAGSVGGDLISRLLCKEAEHFLGQPIAVVNKTGGSFTIGVGAIASAKPDGYTIGYPTPASLFITPFLQKVPYDPIKDLQPIIQFGQSSFGIAVKGDSPFKTFQDLIAYARQNPKKLTYGTGGAYSSAHIAMEKIAKKEGIQWVHMPYKGGSEIQAALLGGHIQFAGGDFSRALIESGQTRVVLMLAEERHAEYPQIPILKDIGFDMPYPALNSVIGPKGLPEPILKKLEDAFTKAVKDPAFVKGMKDLHMMIVYRNSKDLEQYVTQTYRVFEKAMKEIKPD